MAGRISRVVTPLMLPGIAHFGIEVDPFDKAAVSEDVAALGGTVLPAPGNADVLPIRDPDGNVVQLHPV